ATEPHPSPSHAGAEPDLRLAAADALFAGPPGPGHGDRHLRRLGLRPDRARSPPHPRLSAADPAGAGGQPGHPPLELRGGPADADERAARRAAFGLRRNPAEAARSGGPVAAV